MAKYDVVQKVNGNLTVISTWVDDKNGAKQAYHNQCKLLYADKDTTSGYVAIFDDNLDVLEDMKEFINKA